MRRAALLLAGALAPATAFAAPQLDPVWTDHTIIQRGRPIVVEGTAAPGGRVEARLGAQTVQVRADRTGRFTAEFAPLEASDDTRAITRDHLARFTGFKNQRARADFRVKAIRAERELWPVPGYQPQFRAYPIVQTPIEVGFTDAEYRAVEGLRGRLGKTDGDAVRAAFMLWYQRNRMKPHWIRPEGFW